MQKNFKSVLDNSVQFYVGLMFIIGSMFVFQTGDTARFGFIFLLLGLLIMGLFKVCRIDHQKNLATLKLTFFFIPLSTRLSMPANSIEDVKMIKKIELQQRDEGTDYEKEFYVISLSGTADLQVNKLSDFFKARIYAERLAKKLNLPLRDISSGSESIRQAEELDMNLGQRLRYRKIRQSNPLPPSDSEIELINMDTGQALRFPNQPQPWYVYMFVIGVILIIFTAFWFNDVEWAAGLFVLPIGGYLLFNIVVISIKPSYLEFRKDGLQVKRFHYRRYFDYKNIEEVIRNRDDIYIITDKKRAPVPYGFYRDEDAQYVIDLIQYRALQHQSANAGS